jgi:hypothetical protein
MTTRTDGGGRRKGPRAGRPAPAGPKPKGSARHRGYVNAGRAPDDADDTLPMALTFDVDATPQTAEPDGMVDDYPRVDGAFPEDPDAPDAGDGRRRR